MTAPRIRPATPRRRAILARCPHCHAPILAGHDDNGWPTTTDPAPITRTTELALHLTGTRTFAIENGQLVRRDRWRIRRPTRHPVVPEHHCGTHHPAAATPTTDPKQAPDVPPF